MPRRKGTEPRLVAQQHRQAKHRAKLKAAGRPEVSAVDIAVADAVGRAVRQLNAGLKAGHIQASDPRRHLLYKVVDAATAILVESGCSADQASTQIDHRFRAPRKRRSPPITC